MRQREVILAGARLGQALSSVGDGAEDLHHAAGGHIHASTNAGRSVSPNQSTMLLRDLMREAEDVLREYGRDERARQERMTALHRAQVNFSTFFHTKMIFLQSGWRKKMGHKNLNAEAGFSTETNKARVSATKTWRKNDIKNAR